MHNEEVIAVDSGGEDSEGGIECCRCAGYDSTERNDGALGGGDVRLVGDVGVEGHGPVVE